MPTYKRGKHWHYAFMIRGVRYRGAIPEARTKAQAERVEAKRREEVYEGTYGRERKPITFRRFVEDEYLPIAKETTRKFSTNIGYQSNRLIEVFGDKFLGQITHIQVEKWLLTLREKYSGATINHFIKRLSAIYNQAIAAGYLEAAQNPMKLVRKVEETPRAKRRLSREEEDRIATAAHLLGYEYVTTVMIVLVETGMRPMEFFDMTTDQVILSEGIIKPVSYKTGRRRSGSSQPKTRIVPLSDRARAEFEKLHAEAITQGRERIFPYRSIKHAWATVLETAEVPEFWLRWLRDEAASRWAEVGMDEFTIAKLLGHSSPKMSMTYVRDLRDRTIEKMNAASATNLPQTETGNLIQLPANR
jgi:integrase